jgi:hypothetical protein
MTDSKELQSSPAVSMAAAFAYANTSLALEGHAVDAAQAERQSQVIDGRMTFAEAIAAAVENASR